MDDLDLARRIAFVAACAARKLNLPARTRPEELLESAMQEPEAVTPEQFKAVYWAWKILNRTDA
jgi:hypothetical protein